MAKPKAGKRGCCGETKRKTLCDATPLKAGTVIEGVTVKGKHCRAHDPDIPDSARFGSHAQAREAAKLGGRPANPRPTEIMRRLVEDHVESVIAPHFRTLGYDVERDEESGELRIVKSENGGAKIFGESKEGDINMTDHDDLGAHIAAAEKLLDRIYGRPKQATELTGAEGGPVEIVPVTREKAKMVDGILAGVGAGGG
ncbi:MAG TPA: hypothetical protein VLC07_03580 [Solirubrobacterales bacterium]|nr:hypothetical protein [Solirubrobacterales bacterium]